MLWEEPPDSTVVAVRNHTSLARDAPEEVWIRCDFEAESDARWGRLDLPRKTSLTWAQLRRRGRIRVAPSERERDGKTGDGYPLCGGCGHHVSGVLGGRCTAFVVLNDGPPWARMCTCMCVEDPQVKAWLERS